MSQNCESHLLPSISTSALCLYMCVYVLVYVYKCIMYMKRDMEKDGRLLIHCALDFVCLFNSLHDFYKSLNMPKVTF